MRSIRVDIGPFKGLELRATFGAARQISEVIADPLFISREAAIEDMMLQRGIPYQPKFMFSVESLPRLLLIGAEAAGNKITLQQMQDAVFEQGFIQCKAYGADYLALIVTPRSERAEEFGGEGSGGSAQPGE